MKLPDAIKQEVAKFSQSSNIKANFEIKGISHDLPTEQETAVLRICQEALTNVRKHSKATEVKVQLNYDKSDVALIVSDNGKGIVATDEGKSDGKHKGFGLISMRERARNVGGQFEVESEPDKGTTIKISLPI